jgi:cation diffusion facilitator family transporter
MSNIPNKLFTKEPKDTSAPEIRKAYGQFAGVIGISTNLFLALIKGMAGFFSGSIAVVADAINNLMDGLSSVITLVGFRMAAKGRDKEHPFGHARIEYMTGVFIAVLILVVGFKLLADSFALTLHPKEIETSLWLVLVLILAILIKVGQSALYYSIAKKIKSSALKASGADSRNDVLATSAALLGVILKWVMDINIDGFMGIAVAVFIIVSGVKLVIETSKPLLGQAPDRVIVKNIEQIVMSNPCVMGMHDLVVHDYGPGRIFASVHVEVEASVSILISHESIDDIEKNVMEKMGIELVCHMDPIDTNDPLIYDLRELVTRALLNTDDAVGMHDLRVVRGEKKINVIFDIVLANESEEIRENIRSTLQALLSEADPRYAAVINFDFDYGS